MVTYTSAILAAANLLAVAHAAPSWNQQPVCKVVVEVISGPPVWVPVASSTASWSTWDPKSSSSSSAAWSTWDPKKTTTTTTAAWASWTGSSSASSTPSWTSSSTWSHPTWTTSSGSSWTTPSTTWTTPVTTWSTTASTTPSTTASTTASTTSSQTAATCAPSSYDFNASPAGSCGCAFTVECNMHASYGAQTNFWEQTSGQLVDTLEQCIEMCNNNADCQATVWSAQDPTDTQDYKRCWQISGLGATVSTGFGQISRKGSCSGTCSSSYN